MSAALPSPLAHAPDLRFRVVHGCRRAFRVAGAGLPIVLVHGIRDSSATGDPVLPAFARRHVVIAPDLLGHGSSDEPRADSSVAAYAHGVRDPSPGTPWGGGGAMQFAYQFSEHTERLVLVGSGGAGPDVTAVLRGITVPGATAALGLLRLPAARPQVGAVVALLRALHTDLGLDARDRLRMVDALPDATARSASDGAGHFPFHATRPASSAAWRFLEVPRHHRPRGVERGAVAGAAALPGRRVSPAGTGERSVT